MRYGMIMAGGRGTRLWPMSRGETPKQLLPFIGGRSLLEIALDRLDDVLPRDQRLVCTNRAHREAVQARARWLTDEQILGEPTPRDTVNAVGLTAAVLAQRDPSNVFAVLTADHVITPQATFAACLERAFALVENRPDRMATFAITPTRPATEYGYVKLGPGLDEDPDARRVEVFKEKPDEATAKRYLAHGAYGWNSGMFVFHAAGFMDAFARSMPDNAAGLREIAAAWDTPERTAVLDRIYPTLEKQSVDIGVMEPAAEDASIEIVTVPMAVEWLDVGSWPSFGETLAADEDGNRASVRTLHVDSSNILATSDDPDHVIATIGCDNLIIVRTNEITLVCHADRAQDVKTMAESAPPELR